MTVIRWGIQCVFAGLIVASGLNLRAAELRNATARDEFRFLLQAESNAIYSIEMSTNLTDWREATRSYEFETNRVVIFSNHLPRAFFRARRTNEPLFPFTLAAREAIDLASYNLSADSFDPYDAGKSTNGRYDPAKRRDNASCSAPDGILNSIGTGTLSVWGRIAKAPGAALEIGRGGKIGDTAWLADASTAGAQPGSVTNQANMRFPNLPPPFTNGLQPVRNMSVGGVTYDWVLMSGFARDYAIPAGQNLSGKVYVTGNTRLYVGPTSTINLRGSDTIVLATNASIQIYGDCTNAFFGGSIVNPGTATNFLYFGTARNTNTTFAASAPCVGTFYAPAADFTLGSGNSTPVDVFGAVVANRIKLNGNFSFHFDENLLRAGPKR